MVHGMQAPKAANSMKKPVNPLACELDQYDYKRDRQERLQPLIKSGVGEI